MQLDSWLAPRPAGAPAMLVCGTMNFGRRTTAAESERIIARALERGVPWFDTANAYNDGESERIVGKGLRGQGERARIATKCGFGRDLSRPEGLGKATVQRACEESLQRLSVEAIDLYYLHRPDPATPIEETLGAVDALMRAGKIRAWAVSNFASWQIAEICFLCDKLGYARPVVSQVIYNLLIRQLDVEYFRFAKRFGIHTTTYNPLAGGLLAGKGLPGRDVEKGSRFDVNRMYRSRYLSERFFELVAACDLIAHAAGLSLVDLAYRWTAARPGVDSILLGPASVEQLDVAVDACAKPLPEGVSSQLDELHRAFLGTDTSYAR